jgi:DNA primase
MADERTREEIRSRLDIVQLVSEYIKLSKAGVRFRAPCPFHNEKDPSFYVSPERQRYHCFGCNEDGDVFEFVMKMEGMDFPEALKHLAQKAGVELPEYKPDPNRAVKAEARDRLYQANEAAAQFWHQVLLKHPQAEAARAYIEKRGLDQNTVDEFMIGYAPESWEATTKYLMEQGFREAELVGAGVSSKSEKGRGAYDRFRNRVMFPIRDAHGKYVGASGRILPGADGKDPEGEAKYINTAQTDIYYKGDILFAFDLAKQAIRKAGVAVVVEGNMDAIASHQAGIRNVVASSGTAFTDKQLNLIKKLATKLVLSFDADEAGEKAARRSIELAVSAGFEVRIVQLPPDAGKDPDDVIRKDPALWQQAIDNAIPFMDWYLERARSQVDFRQPEQKAQAVQELLGLATRIAARTERGEWLNAIAQTFGVTVEDLRRDWQAAQQTQPQYANPSPRRLAPEGRSAAAQETLATSRWPKPTDRYQLVSDYLVGLVVAWPELAETIIDQIEPDLLEPTRQPLYTELILHYTKPRTDGKDLSDDWPSAFRPGDDPTGSALTILELQAEREFGEMPAEARAEAIAKIVGEIKQLHADRRKRQLAAEMAQAERANDSDRMAEIQQQLNQLID